MEIKRISPEYRTLEPGYCEDDLINARKVRKLDESEKRDVERSHVSENVLRRIVLGYERGDFDKPTFYYLLWEANHVIDLDDLRKKYHPRPEFVDEDIEPSPELCYIGALCALRGAIYGDIAGSNYEFMHDQEKRSSLNTYNCFTNESRFTDDTVLMLATKHALESDKDLFIERNFCYKDIDIETTYPFPNNPFADAYYRYGRTFKNRGYGRRFQNWLSKEKPLPYGSHGNGSAVRAIPIGCYFKKASSVIVYAAASAAATHNHLEGVKGAVVTAVCVWMAVHGFQRREIYTYAKHHYPEMFDKCGKFTSEEISNACYTFGGGKFQSSCMTTVPTAIICFLCGNSYDSVINKALSIDGDTDTIAAIAGGIAGAYYGFPHMETLADYGIFDLI